MKSFEFDPPPSSSLNKKFKDGKTFYNHMCENCDIRKSCKSYRNFKSKGKGSLRKIEVKK
ncbi:MAG: hypothetical protein IJS51_07780 [Treponema sp.]|nr:hypothetical protein [Treponema sp.]MBQ7620011.1 hypothetical protein [Treponema sp.]